MEPSSHVMANLDLWVQSEFITGEQRESILQLVKGAVQDAYEYGLANAYDGYDTGYVTGWEDGYSEGLALNENSIGE